MRDSPRRIDEHSTDETEHYILRWALFLRELFSGVDRLCTHNVPHTAPLGVVIEYVVLGRRALGGA